MTESSVFLIDGDNTVVSQLSSLFADEGWRVLTFGSAREFLKCSRPPGPACLVLETALPDGAGVDLLHQLAQAGTDLPMVFIARSADVRAAVEMMRCGARDVLLKPLRERELLDSVRHALEYDRAALRRRIELTELLRRKDTLTERERTILEHVVNGKLNKQVAAELAIAEGTVKVHRHRVMKKMGAASLAELVRMTDRISAAKARNQ